MQLTELVRLPAAVDELTRRETSVTRVREHRRSLVEGTTEAGADGEETRRERGDEVLASTGGDNGVHRTGHQVRHTGTRANGGERTQKRQDRGQQ